MGKVIKRMMQVLRKTFSNNNKKRTINKTKKQQRGGAVYSFDFNDKVGGMPARVSLNGTVDGDCPKGNVSDLGITNYKVSGGRRKGRKSGKRTNKRNHKKNSKNSKKNNGKMHVYHKSKKTNKSNKSHNRH